MTALDPTPIVEELRREWDAFRQYRPETVRRLIAATERTGALPLPPAPPLPFPRGGRSTAPADLTAYGRGARPVTRIGTLCCAPRPAEVGVAPVRCSEPYGHDQGSQPSDHVARGNEGRELARWAVAAPHCRTPALPSGETRNAHHWTAGGGTR